MPIPPVDWHIVDGNDNDVPHDGEGLGEIVEHAPW